MSWCRCVDTGRTAKRSGRSCRRGGRKRRGILARKEMVMKERAQGKEGAPEKEENRQNLG